MLTDVPARPDAPTTPVRALPMIVTEDLPAVRRFYVDTLGCEPVLDMEGYLNVRLTPGEDSPELAFVSLETEPDAARAYAGGFMLSIPVRDADAVQERLGGAGLALATPVRDWPWRWRSVRVFDPAGVLLDFYHPIGDNAEE